MTHNVEITNTDANWLAWGQLVDFWIRHPHMPRPETVGELRDALSGNNPLKILVEAVIHGSDSRPVEIEFYPDIVADPKAPIYIMLPTARMLDDDKNLLKPNQPYPLNSFYDANYMNPTPKKPLPLSELEEMMLRRLGEYVVNECM